MINLKYGAEPNVRPPSTVSSIGDSYRVKILFAAKSHGPNTTALSYTCIASAMLNLGGSK